MENVIFVDLCNTVADINCELQKLGIDTIQYPAHTQEPIDWLLLFSKAEPIDPVVSLVKELSREFNIIYLTARPIHSIAVSYHWIKKHGLPQAPILHTRGRRKGKFVAHYGDRVVGMIEDSPEEIESVLEVNPGIELVIPDWNYNRQFKGKHIEIHRNQQALVDRLKALHAVMGELSPLWDSLDEEQIALLEKHYPFHQSLDELAVDVADWVESVISKSKNSLVEN